MRLGEHDGRGLWGAEHLLISAQVMITFSIGFTHLRGRAMHRDYEAFQPFCGGLSFVVLQGAAWSLYSLALVITLSWLYIGLDRNGVLRLDGAVASNGLLLGVAQLLLTASLPHFDPRHSRGKSHVDEVALGSPRPPRRFPKGTKRFSLTMSLASLLLLGLADWVMLADSDLSRLFFFVPDEGWARFLPLQLCGSITLLVSLPITIFLQAVIICTLALALALTLALTFT